VSFELSNIRKSTDAEPEVLPVEGASDGPRDARFADSGRAAEAEDLALHAALQLRDCDEF